MSGIWAIIPIKQLQQSKSRLSFLLTAAERARLMRHLLTHLLDVVAQVPQIANTLVITPDEEVAQIVAQYPSAQIVPEATAGLNLAVTQAVGQATLAGASGVLVLPADLPFVQVADLVQMVTAVRQPYTMVICTDRKQDGTNALLLSPPQPFRFYYGVGSFAQHLAEAEAQNYQVLPLQLEGLTFDLDTEADWRVYTRLLQKG